MRMVVFKKSSRFAFNLINETKAKVKISEGSYENKAYLQKEPMKRAFCALRSFLNIANALKSRKIFCVATSALRDAPNANEFIKRVREELGLNIKIITGEKEALYGGIAALNLLHIPSFTSVDIGGGSTEFCIVKDSKIVKTFSLNLGTVRLKELFFVNKDYKGALNFVLKELEKIQEYKNELKTIIGIGGTIRALGRAIMKESSYPMPSLHGFTYHLQDYQNLINTIVKTDDLEVLRNSYIKKDRYDTIQEGTFIFKAIVKTFESEKITTSGAGVREGVYLSDLLRNSAIKFPHNFNPSVKSLLDRFEICPKQSAYLGLNASCIFKALESLHSLESRFRQILVIASKLYSIGVKLSFYKYNENAFSFILNALNYKISHEDKALIAHIIKYSKKALPCECCIVNFKELLPEFRILKWLSFMINLNLSLNADMSRTKMQYELSNNILKIKSTNDSYLVRTALEKLELPNNLEITYCGQ